jgi:hypothetical protein
MFYNFGSCLHRSIRKNLAYIFKILHYVLQILSILKRKGGGRKGRKERRKIGKKGFM